MHRILVIGSTGQIGSDLTLALRERYAAENVIAAGHTHVPDRSIDGSGPACTLDVRDREMLETTVKQYRIDTIFHLASLLSAVAENRPQQAWDINMNGLLNVLETARLHNCALFFPSSIGVFGPLTPKDDTPQDTILQPNTIYGITKVSGELLCDYYHRRYAVNTRGVRYPGLISYKALPGGGTTDYAVHIFYAALQDKKYTCFLKPDARLDMMYMPDAVNAAIQLMEADDKKLVHRNGYNITAMSFSPEEIAGAIKKHIPGFAISYEVDPVRQAIADSWPRHMDDSIAKKEWGWKACYDLDMMVEDMLNRVSEKLETP